MLLLVCQSEAMLSLSSPTAATRAVLPALQRTHHVFLGCAERLLGVVRSRSFAAPGFGTYRCLALLHGQSSGCAARPALTGLFSMYCIAAT